MLRPFEKIMAANVYALKYNWRDDKVNIVECLEQTHKQYGDRITEKDFTALITLITKGGRSSVLNYRREIAIIKKLCTLFPDLMNNTKIIGCILKCINVHSYPQQCITDITSIGYKFTEPQIAILNKEGYTVFDVIETMSYAEFLSLFDNSTFMQKMYTNIHSRYDILSGKLAIDNKIETLKETIDKFGIVLDSKFISTFLSKCPRHHGVVGMVNDSYTVLNVHIIANKLGLGQLSKEDFLFLAEKYTYFYSPMAYSHIWAGQIFSDTDRNMIILNARKVLTYYDKPITRDLVLHLMTPDAFVTFVTPDTTDYDPIEDIFFILFSISKNCVMNDTRYIIIKHFLDNGYLIYDKFLMLLISLGLTDFNQNYKEKTNTKSLLVELMNKGNISPTMHEIDNIFTFCHFSTINALSDIKILPTKDLMSQNLYKVVVDSVVNNSVFVDDETTEYSELINSYTDEGISSGSIVTPSDTVKVYESLNDRDKQIFMRIPHDRSIVNIIRYGITLTKEYVISILSSSNWKNIVFLLHLSKEYRYILDFIDESVILSIPSFIGRLWFSNNILIKNREVFALPNKFYKLRPNIDQDVMELLSKPLINDIDALKKNIKHTRETNRLAIIANGSSIRRVLPNVSVNSSETDYVNNSMPTTTVVSLSHKGIKDTDDSISTGSTESTEDDDDWEYNYMYARGKTDEQIAVKMYANKN